MKKRVHKELRPVFEKLTPMNLSEETIQEIREASKKIRVPLINEQIVQMEDHVLSKDKQAQIRLKVYAPKEQYADLPVVLFIHGGGYLFGSVEGNDVKCARYVTEIHCVVVSVDYRLAPEHPYPAAIEDCYSALEWIVENQKRLKIDPDRLAVVGGSTGGGLTAALSLLTRDRKGPKIAFQMPLFPMLDDTCTTQSSQEFHDTRVWNTGFNQFAWKKYLINVVGETPKYAAPMRETDFTNLPPTYTSVGLLDPFRDETVNYVKALSSAGVDVEFHLTPGAFHEFEEIVPTASVSQRSVELAMTALKQGLERIKS